ncbi:MAG: hypothetical protein EON91_01885 [Brevundimonas sp.]|uniref:hypothetical protein n=1 Tax=Brevundimonas sp. TaxID=1871086 RepID=UPI0011FB036E|nr:hypothetical protein [Brevundimonas sp.]RZJ19294.1 MAG: hypothetical protein EON91_01885 [Brevundimonas sp.]
MFAKADLEVRVDDVWLTQSQFTFSGTLLEGGGYQGGTVTLNTPATGTVLIRRHIAPARTSNYARRNNVPVRAIDMAFNRLTAVDQDMRRDLDRIEDDFAAVVTEAAAVVAGAVAADADRAEAAESGAIAAETEAQGWAQAAGTERDGAEAAKTDAQQVLADIGAAIQAAQDADGDAAVAGAIAGQAAGAAAGEAAAEVVGATKADLAGGRALTDLPTWRTSLQVIRAVTPEQAATASLRREGKTICRRASPKREFYRTDEKVLSHEK